MKKKVIVTPQTIRTALSNSLDIEFDVDRLSSLVGKDAVAESEEGICELVKLLLKKAFPHILPSDVSWERKVDTLEKLKNFGIYSTYKQTKNLDTTALNNLENLKDVYTQEERLHIMEVIGDNAFPDKMDSMLPIIIVLSSQILLDQVYS